MTEETRLKKILIAVLLILAAVFSFFILAEKTSSNAMFSATLASIDQKTERVLALSASAAAISTGVTLLPGDAGSPIAQKIADLSGYFLLILTVLYTEKNLLAVLGAIVFRFVIPIALCLLALLQFWNRARLRSLAVKVIVFSLVVFLAIPISLKVSDSVYQNHQEILDTAASEAEEISQTTDQLSDANGSQNVISSILGKLKESTSGLVEKAAQMLNRFMESIAVMIVTTCVIPLLVLALILWLANKLFDFGLNVPPPGRGRRRREETDAERNEHEEV